MPVPNKLHSRKFWTFWALTVIGGALLYREVLESKDWVDFMVFVWGAYVAGNVGEHFSKTNKPG